MPAAIPLATQVIAVAAVGAAGMSGTVLGGLIVAGAGIVGGMAAQKFFGRDSFEQINAQELIKLNAATTQRTIPLVYGRRMVGSNDVYLYMKNEGNDRYMWIVHCLGEGEVHSIAQEEGNDLIYVNDRLVSEHEAGSIEYWFYNGTSTQSVDPNIYDASGNVFSDPMRNTAYIVFKINYDSSTFYGIPKRTVVLNGIKVFDFRSSTTGWSQNPVLILYDYITNTRYGLGWDPALLDATGANSTWVSAANYCDIDTVGKPKLYMDYVIGSQLKSQTVIDTILAHFRGSISWFGGKLFLHYANLNYESVVATLTDEHIARDGSTKVDSILVAQPSRYGLPDGVLVKFVNSRNNWTLDDFPIGDSNGQIQQIEFPGYTDRSLAMDMGLYVLERQRLNRVYNIVLRPDTIVLDINDVISLTSTELAVTNQLCRVLQSNITSDGLIQATLVIEDLSLYDSIYQPDTSAIYSVDLLSPLAPPPSVEGATAAEQTYSYRDRTYIRLNISFDPPSEYPWFSHVDAYVAHQEPPDWSLLLSASSNFQIDPVQEDTEYQIKLVTVSVFGVKQEFDDAYSFMHYVTGINNLNPPSPLYLTATVVGNSVDLYSPPLDSPDIHAWEYRLGAAWDEAVFISSQKYPPITYTGIRPGSHRIWLDTWRSVNPPFGLYGVAPVYADIVMTDPPPGYFSFISHIIDFEHDGVHSNTEAVEFGPQWGLKCSHEDDSLTGTYTSIEYDLYNTDLEVILIYLLFVFDVTGTTTTWNEMAPYPTSWSALPPSNSWAILLGLLDEPTRLEIDAYCSETPGGPYSKVDRMELLTSTVKARYVKLTFKITDISDNSYLRVHPTYLIGARRRAPVWSDIFYTD